MPKIKNISAREILDSRGYPTVEVKLTLENGIQAKAAIPSGASTGKHEALELRDNDLDRYAGKGVLKACENVEKIIRPALIGQEPEPQKIDETIIALDGTKDKSKLGANAILGVSMACARAAAQTAGLPLYKYLKETYQFTTPATYRLPVPMLNVINGGRHADNKMDIQEFMILPLLGRLSDSPAGRTNKIFKERMRAGAEIFQTLKNIIKSVHGLSVAVGDEGGFAPRFQNNEEALKVLVAAIKDSRFALGKDIALALDVAASEFYNTKENKYLFEGRKKSAKEMIELYQAWTQQYPIISIEDGLAEDDWSNWTQLLVRNRDLMVIGDDLFTTNVERLSKGIEIRAANAILIKLNQIGTLTETMNCIKLAQKNNFKIVISHRSGETNDDFIADLAVAVGAEFIKTGAPDRGERVAKYNRLMEIEDEIMKK